MSKSDCLVHRQEIDFSKYELYNCANGTHLCLKKDMGGHNFMPPYICCQPELMIVDNIKCWVHTQEIQ